MLPRMIWVSLKTGFAASGGPLAWPFAFLWAAANGCRVVDEIVWARLIFALGAVVTLATVAMIIQGHLHWRGRGASDVR